MRVRRGGAPRQRGACGAGAAARRVARRARRIRRGAQPAAPPRQPPRANPLAPPPTPRPQALLRKGGAAASGVPNAQLLPALERASAGGAAEGAGDEVFADEGALAGLCARLHEVGAAGRAGCTPQRAACGRARAAALAGVQACPDPARV